MFEEKTKISISKLCAIDVLYTLVGPTDGAFPFKARSHCDGNDNFLCSELSSQYEHHNDFSMIPFFPLPLPSQ